jgi:hypothetical protein
VAFFLLTQIDRFAHFVSFFSLPDDVEKALIAISKVTHPSCMGDCW